MANTSLITVVQLMLGSDAPTTEEINVYLDVAEMAILNRLYPFGIPTNAEVPSGYNSLQCQLAVRYISRRGAEGQTGHSENGISRTFDSANDEDLLSVVTPHMKVFG